jgi:hypothetical protein
MKAGRFRQIRNLFDAALEKDPSTRNSFLAEACLGDQELLLEVGKLLAAHGQPTAWIDDSILGEPLPRLEGRRIGRYEILRQLGEGGMGTVYLAALEDFGERQVFALKIVRPEAVTEAVLRRFKREREILETLNHPNIARVHGGGTTGEGLPYLVMDFVDGRTIDTYCDEHELDIPARMKLFRDVCAAVQYAHEQHVVHRDLKPSNILVTSDGVVKLLDFGIARMAGTGPDSPTRLTRSDMLLMTPEYASPEQISGATVTPASDVYALGVVLYELLTGRRPYHLKSRVFHEIARIICEEPPDRPSTAAGTNAETADAENTPAGPHGLRSPAELRRSLSGNIDAILLKALEKHPLQRYSSVRALSEDILHHVEGRAVAARRHAFTKAASRFGAQQGWWITGLALLAFGVYSGKVSLPPEVWFIVTTIAAVFLIGYHLGSWARGKDHTRATLTRIATRFLFMGSGPRTPAREMGCP